MKNVHPSSAQHNWTQVDDYLNKLLIPTDSLLEQTLQSNAKAGLPAHDVAPNQGKLLQLLLQIHGAARVLEIGTLGGYSTIWMARALPEHGKIVTLEADPHHAEMARTNLTRAGLINKVDLRVGPALTTLPDVQEEYREPFDFIFIDADKPSNPDYLRWALRLSRPGSLIIGDNIVRDGEVVNAESTDNRVQGVRQFLQLISENPRLEATALQTVGSKGYDGFVIARVIEHHDTK
ncbi:O-methyltransferase [Paenibacillus xylanilyticus]|uniref:O-methyltransferase n=1 Tax=Paenibacillus xylanilyticus TaxID=248903 RepID=A0A7Y6EWB1_9BACL|nr:O-methyltransferase [Paenibacillus xylanilyticus]NUU76569.1 O-methyltransferase [Paenibacillus xylanilyticus]